MSEQLCRDGDMFPDREHDPYCDLSRGIGGCNCLPDFGAPERVWIRHGTDVYTRSVPDADEYVLAESIREICCVTEGVLCMPEEPCTCCTIRDEREDSGDAKAPLLAALCGRKG